MLLNRHISWRFFLTFILLNVPNTPEINTNSNNADIKMNIPVEKITLDRTSVTLKKNGTHKLVVKVSPENTTVFIIFSERAYKRASPVGNHRNRRGTKN